ncbi:MAG TPA: hypothetical protein VEQ59_23275, partial [Polyangiaceae bacterium]|nr:hypothetical protein [Polyangiaceae bacterium]
MTASNRNYVVLFGVVFVAALIALVRGRGSAVVTSPAANESGAPPPVSAPPPRGREQLVGSAICADCHRAQSDAYAGSHHAKALVEPRAEKHFDGTQLAAKLGGVTQFALRDGTPVVTTPLPGGKTATLPIRYVSGV